jgi:hypothetical protein
MNANRQFLPVLYVEAQKALRTPLKFAALLGVWALTASARDSAPQVGVAKMDITPDYPIRLSGYAARTSESEGIEQRLWAKALAIGSDREGPAILVTVDSTGVPGRLRNEVSRRLQRARGIPSERFALCSTHTHCAPHLPGYLPNLFPGPLPADQQARIERYTRELADALEQVALAALKNRSPARLSWGQTSVAFAANRRTKGGPVDHDLPVLLVADAQGAPQAVLLSYACHCTTLSAEFNKLCGDWAGFAQEQLERDLPGSTVLVAIGCGADANPLPRPGLENAQRHGQAIATAVNALLSTKLASLTVAPECRARQIELPFGPLPTRAEWEARTQSTNSYGRLAWQARQNLARLDCGETLPSKLPYLIQTWSFGDDLAMVFLPGEVVVDYSRRLKRECDRPRLWINAYANDVPCYIPSERLLREGGYESGGAMVYYDQPAPLAPGVEALIVDAVRDLLPRYFSVTQTLPPTSSP